MKYKVIKAFSDRDTGTPYNVGYEYETTDKKRVDKLQKGGFIGIASSEVTGGTDNVSDSKEDEK